MLHFFCITMKKRPVTGLGLVYKPIPVCLLARDLILSWKGLVSTTLNLEFGFEGLRQLLDDPSAAVLAALAPEILLAMASRSRVPASP